MRDADFIPIPLCPDLSGESPVMLPADALPGVYGVEVCWPEGPVIDCRKLTVLAHGEADAARRALATGRESFSPHAEVVDVRRMRRRPTTREISRWKRGDGK